jgi:hypothetical protein
MTGFDLDAMGRVLKTLPDDATKDTPEQKDIRQLVVWAATAAQILQVVQQRASDLAGAAKELVGDLPPPEEP